MKISVAVFMLILLASNAATQVQSDSSAKPNVIVLQKKWRMEVRNAALDGDYFKAQSERNQEEQARRERERLNEKLSEQGMPTRQEPYSPPKAKPGGSGISVVYIYEVKIRNTGDKSIHKLAWDYVFSDPATEQELGRRRFVSEIKIGPGKTKNVIMRASTSPTGTIDAAKTGKESQGLYSEKVIVQSINYADGSVWKAASN